MNDKEGRKWLLQKLYDRGFKYIFRSGGLCGYLAVKQPPKIKNNCTYVDGSFERIDILSDLIPDFNEPNYLDIGKYLGIIDWSKIPVDTPIIVEMPYVTVRRYFAKYDGKKIFYFSYGATNWSSKGSIMGTNPCNVRLAGGDDEN